MVTFVSAGQLQSNCNAKGIAQLQKNYRFYGGSNFNHETIVSDDVVDQAIQYAYRIIASYPHSRSAFTQGLLFHQGKLYESTGQYGRSQIRKVDLASGLVQQAVDLKSKYFGEGLSLVANRLVQLSWKSGRAFMYDPDTLRLQRTLSIGGESWGSAAIDDGLLVGDGSSSLRVIDLDQLKTVRTVQVKQGQTAVRGINEMELVNGTIFANVWPSDCIVQFSPHSGQVLGWLDLSGLLPQRLRAASSSVLNGIAYANQPGRLLVTGKNWPTLFEIEIF